MSCGEAIQRQFTMQRVLTVLYVLAVVVVSCWVSESRTSSFYKAARELGANTRLSVVDLKPEPMSTLDDRLRLKRARDQLVGQYLTRDLHRGEAVAAGCVLPWPDMKDVVVTPVQLEAEPDLRMINQGAMVEVSVGDTRKQLEVLAIVLSNAKWFALFRTKDIGDVAKDEPKLLRILSMPAATTVDPVPPAAEKC
jgi:hypothetical protein